jgi:hypothetical protein
VTPFAEIVSTPHRGRFTGNRGIIHDPATRTLLNRRWSSKAWITCVCEFKGRRRKVMGGRSWTELFFLDEATAFAAGHRPCFYCRRAEAITFRDAWAKGNDRADPYAKDIDEILHRERLDRNAKRLHALPLPARQLPNGTMIAMGKNSYVVADGEAWLWSFAGYSHASETLEDARLLTPPSIVNAFRAGYRPDTHASVPNIT